MVMIGADFEFDESEMERERGDTNKGQDIGSNEKLLLRKGKWLRALQLGIKK